MCAQGGATQYPGHFMPMGAPRAAPDIHWPRTFGGVAVENGTKNRGRWGGVGPCRRRVRWQWGFVANPPPRNDMDLFLLFSCSLRALTCGCCRFDACRTFSLSPCGAPPILRRLALPMPRCIHQGALHPRRPVRQLPAEPPICLTLSDAACYCDLGDKY